MTCLLATVNDDIISVAFLMPFSTWTIGLIQSSRIIVYWCLVTRVGTLASFASIKRRWDFLLLKSKVH